MRYPQQLSRVHHHYAVPRWGVAMLLVMIVTGLVSVITAANQDLPAVIEVPAEIDTTRLAGRISELSTQQEQNGDFPAALAQELALLRETQQFLEQGAAALATADRFSGEARSAPEQLAQIDTFLATPTDQLVSQVDRSLPLEDLNAQLEAARVQLQAERDLRAKVDTDQEFRSTRRAQIPADRARATERLDALSATLAAGSGPDEPEGVVTARRWHALAEQYLRLATLRALDEELRNYDARRALLDKRRANRDRRIAVETRNVAALQEAIGAKQIELAEAAEREAARQRRAAATSHPLVRSILEESQVITARNTEILGLSGADATAKTKADALLIEWTTAFERSKARVERVGLSNAIGQHLRNQGSRLPDPHELRQQMAARDRQVGDLVNEAEDLSPVLDELVDIDDAVQTRLESYSGSLPIEETEREELRLAARDALSQQRDYLTTLNVSINDYLDNSLIKLQDKQRELYELLVEYIDFIDERILWTRSAEVILPADLRASSDAGAWLVDEDAWNSIASKSWRDVQEHAALYGMYLPALIVLWLIQPLLRRRLRLIADKTKRYTSDTFSLTMAGLGITLLMAAAVPALMAFIAWRLSIATVGDSLGTGLSDGLFRAAELLFIAGLIRILCRPGGVGEAHFRWKPPTLRAVRHHLRWLVPIVVPLTFIVGVTSPNDNHYDSLGRFAFIASMIAFAVFLQRILRPSAGILRTVLVQQRGGWLDRLKYVWYPLIVLSPIAGAVVAGLGYFYSAIQLEQRVLDTTWLLLLILVGRAILLRGLFLAQRRLDIEQRKKKKRAAQAELEAEKASAGTPTAGPETPAVPEATAESQVSVPEAKEIDVAEISSQTRRLLNASVAFAVLIGLALVWLDMLPALGFFREIELWTPDSGIPAAVATEGDGADPATMASLPPEPAPITLSHVVYSILILLMTAMVSQNIPGLLEIVLLQRLPISPSGRYAITTLVRYVLVIVGVVLAFNAIGIGWSKVQWLAAAITVGLGFGLQEIFANFVSGLIILFERPIRVGDWVTVGDLSGSVSRLRIRATTIVDRDRKELIVPNKEFVTGKIVNWTLTDPFLRVVIHVGIAYGSDTKLAEEILYRVAKAEDTVLDEPESSVVFNEFGDSSLNFELRVFISHIKHYFQVRHDLHCAIDQEFRKAGIVIAFPQRDVHMYPTAERVGTEESRGCVEPDKDQVG